MGPLMFTVLSVAVAMLWVPKGLVRMPAAPRVLNLPVVFSFLFLMYFTQHIFIKEMIFDIPVSHWLVLTDPQRKTALAFLLTYFVVFWLGYAVHAKSSKQRQSVLPTNNFPTGLAVACLAFGALAIYIQATGGLHQFLTNHRETVYLDQWSRSADAVFSSRVRIITGFIFSVAAVIGGYLAGVHDKAGPIKKLVYYSLPLPGTLVKLALFSRGVFLFYALFFLSKTIMSRKRVRYFGLKIVTVMALVMAGIVVGLQGRATHAMSASSAAEVILFASNSINGLSPFLDTVAVSMSETGGGLHRVLLELSPIPSFIYSSPYQSNLSTLALGRTSGSSAPMPFIGEAYFNMGWGGLVVAYLQGFLAALVNSKIANPTMRDRGWWLLLYITTVYSFLYMPHSGLRSCTRPLVWVFTLFGMRNLLRMIAPRRSRGAALRSAEPETRALADVKLR